MRYLTKLISKLRPTMKFLYTIWSKASRLFMLFSDSNDQSEPETNAALNHNFQSTLDDRLAKYEKQINDSFDSLLSRLMHPDDIPSSNGDGDRNIDDSSSARRKEFVEKVNIVREVFQNEFRNDIAKLISSKYSTDMDTRQEDLTSESFDEMVRLFQQLKVTDSSVIDQRKYSGVINLLNFNIRDKDSNADAIELLEKLTLFGSNDCNDSRNDESIDDVIEVVKDVEVVSVNSSDDNDSSSSESKIEENSNTVLSNSLIEPKCVSDNESVSEESPEIEKDDDVIEVIKHEDIVILNSSNDDDSSRENNIEENSTAILDKSFIEQKCTCGNESAFEKSTEIEQDDVIEVKKDVEMVVLNSSNKNHNSSSESEIEEKYNPKLGHSSPIEQKSSNDIDEDEDLMDVVRNMKSLVLNSSDDDDSSSEIEIDEKFTPKLGNSTFKQEPMSDDESISVKSFASDESEITLPEGDAFKTLIKDLSFSSILSPRSLASKQKNTAIEFTNFMVDRRLITIESRLSEHELKSMYDTYEAEVNPEVSIADQVLSVLQSNDIVKQNISLSDENNNEVEFKEIVYLNRNHDIKSHFGALVPFIGDVMRAPDPNFFSVFRSFSCSVCKECYPTKDKFDDHNISEMHIIKTIHLKNRSWFIKNIDYMQISGVPDDQLGPRETKTYEISFTNISQDANKVYIWKIFELVYLGNDVKIEYGSNYCIENGDTFKIKMTVKFTDILPAEEFYPIVLKVSQSDVNEYNFILIEPHLKVVRAAKTVNCAMKSLKSYRPPLKTQNNINKRCSIVESSETRRPMVSDAFKAFHPNKRTTRKNVAIASCRLQKVIPKCDSSIRDEKLLENSENEEKAERLRAPRIAREKKIPKLRLPENAMPPILKTMLKSNFKTNNFSFSPREEEELKYITKLLFEESTFKMRHNKDVLAEYNYIDRLRYEMWIEEYQLHEELRSFNQKDVHLLTDRLPEDLIGISLSGLSEGRPSLMRGDIIIIKCKSPEFPVGFVICEGSVQFVEEKAVYVKLHKTFYAEKYWRYRADVEFRFNRTPLKMSHTVLETLRGYKWKESLFPTTYDKRSNDVQIKSFFNESVARNELQVQAVTNIVQNRAFPAPYILFGPPGTGKTSTLVEAIAQVWNTMKSSRICVCASSNAAADVIAKRLLQYIPLSDIIRIYGLSRNDADIILELQGCSNYDPRVKEVFFPSFAELKSKRIIVMTPVTAGRFILNGITFDYVFMDEAGHTLEVEVLIPFSGFLRSNRCSIILAGDPKQLGPIVRSRYATDLGYGMSLLERLMTQCDIYKKDPITGKYNPKLITKLVKNYRSHRKILHVCNEQFYDGELEATAPEILISSLCLWEELPAKGFPVIFRSVKGTEEKESNSPSYFNVFEIDVVQDYVSKLLDSKDKKLDQSEIGIISPYKKQVQKIRQRLLQKWSKISVASVEEFQGQERKVIIISTVRSRHELVATDYRHGLGFLKNEKRFNVAVSRAMALLIVVGNPDILQCDPNWRAFLKYCSDHLAFVGEPASGTFPDDFDINV